ncbi:MAG TPA: AAA family ATPase [Nitrospirae bacterium]|nr:AAA family ATPase [Nitrospirota bacterium]
MASNLNPSYTFDSFVVAGSNRFACEVARSIAEAPGERYNPVLIYGEEGTGKTHLLHAIGNEIVQNNPELKVGYIPIITLERGIWVSSQIRKIHEILKIFDYYDVFLIDDLHRMDYEALLLLLFYVPRLCHGKRQVVMAYDGRVIDEERKDALVNGFEGVLVVDIKPHEIATRKEIIGRKARVPQGIDLPEDVSDFLSRTDYPLNMLDGLFEKIRPTIEGTEGFIDPETLKGLMGYRERKIIDRVKIDHLIEEFEKRYMDEFEILSYRIERIKKSG